MNRVMNRGSLKRVAFDIGNVLCHVPVNEFYDFVAAQGIVADRKEAEEFMNGIQYAQDLGLYNIRQGFYKFNPHISKKTLQDLHDKWLDIGRPSNEMLEVLKEAIDSGYQVALLSNIGHDHAEVFRQKCELFQGCHQHFSCEVGARKPTKLFYQSFRHDYAWRDDVMFFDDRQENIDAAQGYFRGIRFDIEDYPNDKEAAKVMRQHLGLG
jgi:FMN phosphatase YigB (HAD superfamily)